jgi:hypothetical protein
MRVSRGVIRRLGRVVEGRVSTDRQPASPRSVSRILLAK